MKIAIAGYGVEGQANYRYWSADTDNEVTIVDEKSELIDLPAGVATILGPGAFEKLNGFDLVIRTAGLAPRKIQTDGKIWSGANEFFAKCQAPIIGVTGSKGKGTTASLIASILESAGKKVWLVGNIGIPSLDILSKIQPTDLVVYELSSFQLWDLERSPHTAIVLYIEQEHLDVHADMNEYVGAKAQITAHQTGDDLLVYNHNNVYAQQIADGSRAQKVGYPGEMTAHVNDGSFYYGEQEICSVNTLRIRGAHNLDNACAAIDAVWQYVKDSATIENGLHSFPGLPHRLQFVANVNSVNYYDDSIATTPSSAIAALRAFDGPKTIILGGSSKGSDFTELAHELIVQNAKALLMGGEAEKIAQICQNEDFSNYEILTGKTMAEIVQRAAEVADPNSTVLLSPAAASFDMFKNYADRGDQFQAAVKNL